VLGHTIAGSGTPIGVQGAVPNASNGYGLYTPDDAGIEGTLDTAETDFEVAAGTTTTNDGANVFVGHASNAVEDGAVGATVVGGGRNNQAVASTSTAPAD
jgi:hypothetical protein